MKDNIALARRAGRVVRYHTRQVLRTEDVAQHTFNMMNILLILNQGSVSVNLLKAALLHDQGEYVTGDVPSPVKRQLENAGSALAAMETAAVNAIHYQGFPELTDWEYKLLKVADNLDGLIKATEEVALGNKDLVEVGRVYIKYLEVQAHEIGGNISQEIVKYMVEFRKVSE